MMLLDQAMTPGDQLPLEAFKSHLRLGTGFSDDSLQDDVLESYLRAAIAATEARVGKILLVRTVSWEVTAWSSEASQPLPVAPVRSIISVKITDRTGAEKVVDAERYVLTPDAHRPRLTAIGGTLVSIPQDGSATISFQAGFASDWSDIPADLGQAVFLLAAHYYDNRHDVSGVAGLMPFGVMALLEPYRSIRTLGARA